MAKVSSIVEKSKLTNNERATMKADKTIASMLESSDAATLKTFRNRINTVCDVLDQTGDGAGKRFSGSASHDLADNATAYVDTVRRGSIPKIG